MIAYITIISKHDTIMNKDFISITNKLKQLNNKYWYVRNPTEEEDTVLYYLSNNIPYDSKIIRWKSKFAPERFAVPIE